MHQVDLVSQLTGFKLTDTCVVPRMVQSTDTWPRVAECDPAQATARLLTPDSVFLPQSLITVTIGQAETQLSRWDADKRSQHHLYHDTLSIMSPTDLDLEFDFSGCLSKFSAFLFLFTCQFLKMCPLIGNRT